MPVLHPPVSSALRILLPVAICCGPQAVPLCQAAIINTIPHPADAKAAAINAAIETGDAAAIVQLVSGSLSPVPTAENLRLNSALARAYLLLGQPEAALPFALDAYARARDADAAWLAAELLYATDDFPLGDKISAKLRTAAPTHPALPYLQARRFLCQLALGDAETEWPWILDQVGAARQSAELAAALVADGAPRHDPRFLTAGMELALLELDYTRAADFSSRLSLLRPRNGGLARLALACAFPSEGKLEPLLDQLRARESLPTAELDFWKRLDSRHASAPSALQGWLELSQATASEPKFSAAHLVFLERAITGQARARVELSSSLLAEYGRAARAARSLPHASHAVALRDACHIADMTPDPLAEDEKSVELLRRASRHRRAAELATNLMPAHRNDFEWLARNRAAASRHPDPRAYLGYLLAMEKLQADDPRTLLELARAFDRDTHPRALEIYRRVFALSPPGHPSAGPGLVRFPKRAASRRRPRRTRA